MSDAAAITVKAVVDSNEQAAVSLAAALLESGLTAASGKPVAVRCQFEASLDALKGSREACVAVTSLLPEVANHQQPWPEVESRLRETYQGVTTGEGPVVFVCTIFRHVASGDSAVQSRLVRVRRLNLLAAELSRETGLFVIDLDRSLADIGASKLQTDYRLDGKYASDAAAKVIALAIVSAGLDAFVSFDVQDAARLIINDCQLSLAAPGAATPDLKPSNVLSLGAGRRKQVVAIVVDTNTERHASWLIHLMLTRQFGVHQAVAKLRKSIARRGMRSSLEMVFAAMWQALRGRPRMGE